MDDIDINNFILYDHKHFKYKIKFLIFVILIYLYSTLIMLRKNIRQRREFLFTLENQKLQKQKLDKKAKIIQANNSNSKIPTQLYKQSEKLKKQIQSNDQNNIIPRTHIDDQYNNTIYTDPQILITTCRNPSSKLLQFQKQMALVLPNATRINRGAYVIEDLVNLCLTKNQTDLILLHQHRGVPDGMIVSHLPLGPTIYFGLQNVVLRHDVSQKVDTLSQAYPHLIFHNFSTKIGQRVVNIIKHLFPVPKVESKRLMTFSNKDDIISFRHHTYEKQDHNQVDLNEVGPRFEMKVYQIILGLVNQTEATKQWVLRPYMNTATKRNAL